METIKSLLKTKIQKRKSLIEINKILIESRSIIIEKIDFEVVTIQKTLGIPKNHTSFNFRVAISQSKRLSKYILQLSENKKERLEIEKDLKKLKTIIQTLNIANSKNS